MEYLGDHSAPLISGITLSCHHCDVNWTGCAAAADCPRCGAPKGYHYDDLDACYCFECQGVDPDYEAAMVARAD